MAGPSAAWDRAARLYDLQLWLERSALDAAVELAKPSADDCLLDLGCGTGGLLRRLAGRDDAPREVVGVDASTRMLARVPRLPGGWRLVPAAAAALPFDDDSFDLVTIAYLLHLLDPDARPAVIGEAARVLRPGGRLVAVTVAPPRSRRLAAFLDRAFRHWPLRSGVLAGLRPLDPGPDLEAGGFELTARRRTRRGYPSLILAAKATRASESVAYPGSG